MTNEELDVLQGIALAAMPVEDKTAMSDPLGNLCAFHDAATPAVILELINQLKTCHKLIDVLTKAAKQTEMIAVTRSYFDTKAYIDLCKDIPKLRKEAGLNEGGLDND